VLREAQAPKKKAGRIKTDEALPIAAKSNGKNEVSLEREGASADSLLTSCSAFLQVSLKAGRNPARQLGHEI
jgi:hypothetical protein